MTQGAGLSMLLVALGALVLGAGLAWLVARGRILALRAVIAERDRAAAEREKLLSDAETAMREAFEALASRALRANNQSFLELAATRFGELEARHQAVEQLVQPIQQALTSIDGELRKSEQVRLEGTTRLEEQLRQIANVHAELRGETQRLSRALRAPDARGRWGEIQLRRVVEMAGMVAHCDFIEQDVRTGEEGTLRPDLVVRLPGGKQIVVDAKTPLTGYIAAGDATTDQERDACLRQHAAQVRTHMRKLGERGYWAQFQPGPEFVVMFMPGEAIFSEALRQDPTLIEYGVTAHVIPASPVTLISLLRAIAYGWQQEQMAENAERVAELGRELYRRLRTLVDKFDSVGRHLSKSVQAYNDAVASLETRYLPHARKMKDLGVSVRDELPVLEQVTRATRSLPDITDDSEDDVPDSGEDGV